MELVVDPEGLPDGHLVSIRIGDTRRQAAVAKLRRHSFKFPYGTEACTEPVKLEILQVVSTSLVALRKGQTSYHVPIADGKLLDLHVQESPGKAVEAGSGQDSSRFPLRGGLSEASVEAAQRFQDGAAAAREYLEFHGLLRYIQTLLHACIQARPDDPYAFMMEQLANAKTPKAEGESKPPPAPLQPEDQAGAKQTEASPGEEKVLSSRSRPAREIMRARSMAEAITSNSEVGDNSFGPPMRRDDTELRNAKTSGQAALSAALGGDASAPEMLRAGPTAEAQMIPSNSEGGDNSFGSPMRRDNTELRDAKTSGQAALFAALGGDTSAPAPPSEPPAEALADPLPPIPVDPPPPLRPDEVQPPVPLDPPPTLPMEATPDGDLSPSDAARRPGGAADRANSAEVKRLRALKAAEQRLAESSQAAHDEAVAIAELARMTTDTFREVRADAQDKDSTRRLVRARLEAASRSGELSKAMKEVCDEVTRQAAQDAKDALKGMLRTKLEAACVTGDLDRALGTMRGPDTFATQPESEEDEAEVAPEVSIKAMIRDKLEAATLSGELEDVLDGSTAMGRRPSQYEDPEGVALKEILREKLEAACLSGELDRVLGTSTDSSEPEQVALKELLRGKLEAACLSGELERVLGTSNEDAAKVALKELLRKKLEAACISGELQSALATAANQAGQSDEPVAAEGPVDEPPSTGLPDATASAAPQVTPEDVRSLKARVRCALATACESGALDGFVSSLVEEEAMEHRPSQMEVVKAKVRDTLESAYTSGDLNRALEETHAANETRQDAAEATRVPVSMVGSTEHLRQRLRETLERSLSSGALDLAVGEAVRRSSSDSAEALRLKLRDKALEAWEAGKLQEALKAAVGEVDVVASAPEQAAPPQDQVMSAPDQEGIVAELKENLREALLSSCQSGNAKLEEALSTAMPQESQRRNSEGALEEPNVQVEGATGETADTQASPVGDTTSALETIGAEVARESPESTRELLRECLRRSLDSGDLERVLNSRASTQGAWQSRGRPLSAAQARGTPGQPLNFAPLAPLTEASAAAPASLAPSSSASDLVRTVCELAEVDVAAKELQHVHQVVSALGQDNAVLLKKVQELYDEMRRMREENLELAAKLPP